MSKARQSEIEWIGLIPAHWDCRRIKNFASIRSGEMISKEEYIENGEFPIIGSNGEIGRTDKKNNSDTVITTGRVGSIGTTHIVDDAWITDNALILTVSDIDITYLAYAIPNLDFGLMSSGTAQPLITATKLKQQSIPYPTVEEQQQIAAFLKEKCSQVDELILNVRRQIEKLKLYQQHIIFEAITQGISENVHLRESNVDYLGKINSSYEITSIGTLFKIKKDILGREPEKVLSITQNGIRVKDTDSNKGQNAESYSHYQIVNVGDFAMNHMDLITGGVDISKFEGVTSPDYRVFVLQDKSMNPNYFLRVFQAYYKNRTFFGFGQGVANLGRWRLPASNWSKIQIPVPPVEEQNVIVDFLDKKCSQIDQLIEIKQKKIEKLEQYKKSLIYEYVTGKKEVS